MPISLPTRPYLTMEAARAIADAAVAGQVLVRLDVGGTPLIARISRRSRNELRIEPGAKRLSGGRRGDKQLAEIPIPAEKRIGWRVEEEFVNTIRGREKTALTTFEDGVRYMEFTDAVAKSAASGGTVEVKDL